VPARPPAGGPPDAGSVKFVEDGGDRVGLNVDARHAGYLVLLDSYYAGWTATVDGHAVAIHPANEAFRAVAVPAGQHRIVFTYRPRLLLAAAGVSGLAWVAIVGLIVGGGIWERRWRRPIRSAPPAL
jgi:uncharacterized membrane protein YfhO